MGNQQQVDLGKYDKSQAGTQETDETQIADKQQKYEAPKNDAHRKDVDTLATVEEHVYETQQHHENWTHITNKTQADMRNLKGKLKTDRKQMNNFTAFRQDRN